MPTPRRPVSANDDPAGGGEITDLLGAWSAGDRSALDRLMPLVEAELRRVAHRYLARERTGHTLQSAALVNETYLRLVDQHAARWVNRSQFFGVAASLMRRILTDHARKRASAKRGGPSRTISFDESYMFSEDRAAELVALDDALEALEAVDPRKCRVVEMRFFGGLTQEETAEALHMHPDTVGRDWQRARAFLRRELARTGTGSA